LVPWIVDVVNGIGDPTVADDVAAHLAAAGLKVGSVTTAESTASGIEYPAGERSPAQWLAGQLGVAGLLRTGDVRHVTVVLAAPDSAALLRAIDRLAACR
jgi:hypothetical protein